MPEISVVIPCYNHGRFIEETLASVTAQTFTDWEIIIVDDGSTDIYTQDLLGNAQFSKCRIMRVANGGPSRARNIGIQAAAGRFILLLDADDKIAPTYLQKSYDTIKSDKEIGIVYCLAEYFGQRNGLWALPPYSLAGILKSNMIFISALFRKSAFEAVGGFDETLRYGTEDWDFWLSIIEKTGCRVVRLDEILFYYRKHKVKKNSRQSSIGRQREYAISRQIQLKHIELYRKNLEVLFEQVEELRNQLYKAEEKRKPLKRLWNKLFK